MDYLKNWLTYDYGVKGMKRKHHKPAEQYEKKGRVAKAEGEFGNPYKISSKETEGGTNSIAKYTDENGNWSPERQKLHKEIIDKHFAGKKKPNGQA